MTRLWKLMLYLLINLLQLIYLLVIALCMRIFNLIKGLNPFFILLRLNIHMRTRTRTRTLRQVLVL